MPAFLHFWQGAVTYGEYLDMDYADWLRLREYQRQVEQQVRQQARGRM